MYYIPRTPLYVLLMTSLWSTTAPMSDDSANTTRLSYDEIVAELKRVKRKYKDLRVEHRDLEDEFEVLDNEKRERDAEVIELERQIEILEDENTYLKKEIISFKHSGDNPVSEAAGIMVVEPSSPLADEVKMENQLPTNRTAAQEHPPTDDTKAEEQLPEDMAETGDQLPNDSSETQEHETNLPECV